MVRTVRTIRTFNRIVLALANRLKPCELVVFRPCDAQRKVENQLVYVHLVSLDYAELETTSIQ